MFRNLIIAAIAGLAATAACGAQSFNVDLNLAAGAGAGAPGSSFGGAANQPGVWNSITSASPTTVSLTDTTGAVTGVTLTRATTGSFVGLTIAGTSGDYAKLFDDVQASADFGQLVYTFNNLPFGTYVLYTYGGSAAASDATIVHVTGVDGAQTQSVSGPASNQFVPGVAYTVHAKTVFAGGSLSVSTNANFPGPTAYVSGFQLKKLSGRNRLYVDQNASGLNQDGLTWTTAFPDLQTALRAAQSAGGFHYEIWAASAFYRPTAGTDRAARFVVPNGLRLFGGFSGTEATLQERLSWEFNLTAMSGAIGGASTSDNSYTVCDASDTGANTLIDGWTIASARNNSDGEGGGLKIVNGSPVIRNCKLISNEASQAGAGVYVENGAPMFVNVLFYNNDCSNGQGGGAYLQGLAVAGQAAFVNCEFLGNYAVGDGGGVALSGAPAVLHNCLFSGNTSSFNAGGLYASGEAADFSLINCTLSANASGSGVGGVNFRNGADAKVYSSLFWGNVGAGFMTIEEQQLEQDNNGATTLDLRHTSVQGFASLVGASCDGLNPAFADADGPDNMSGTTDDNCRLLASSPMIDAGNNSVLPADIGDLDADNNFFEIIPFDLDYGVRRVESASHANTGSGVSPIVDRGAYEFVPVCPGDTNGDGVVNFTDLNQVLSDYGQSGFGLMGDVNGDNMVNFLDLNIVLSNFGVQC